MSKGGKVLLQPGFLATHFKTDFEGERNEKIKRNNEICKSYGVKSIATPFVGSVQRKRVTAENESVLGLSWVMLTIDLHVMRMTLAMTALEMPPGRQRVPQSHPEPQSCATMISERVTRLTPLPNMDTQALPPPIAQPQIEALANNNVSITQPQAM